MQNQQQGPPPGPADYLSAKQTCNIAGFGAVVLATTITPFFRRNFGREALGFQGMFACGLLLLLAGADPVGMAYFLAWLLMLIVRRIDTGWRWMKGHVVHSQYAGDSWLAGMFKCSNNTAKRFIEPPLAIGCGIALCLVSPLVGGFVIVCSAALVVVQCMEFTVLQSRVQQMHDAEIEGQYYSGKFRGR